MLLVVFSIASSKNAYPICIRLTPQELALINDDIEQHNEDAKKLYATTHDVTSIFYLKYKNAFDLDMAMTIEKWIKQCNDNKFNFIEKLDTLKIK